METELKSIHDYTEGFLQSHDCTRELALSFDGVIAKCRSNSQELLDKLGRYFRHFLVDPSVTSQMEIIAIEADPILPDVPLNLKKPDPGKDRIKEEYFDFSNGRVVRKRLTDMVFFFGNGLNVAIGPCVANDNQVINFINNRFLQWHLNRRCILGHAAAVKLGDFGLAMAGFSGAGKSTLSLHMMSLGTTFISNDRLLVRNDGDALRMIGVAKLPRVNPGTLLHNEHLRHVIPEENRTRFEALPGEELWRLEHKYNVFVDDIFGADKLGLSATMNGLVILNWKRGAGGMRISEVDLVKRSDLLGAFIKSPGLFYEPDGLDPKSAFSESVYLDHLQHCRVFEVTGGVDFDDAAQSFFDLMGRGA